MKTNLDKGILLSVGALVLLGMGACSKRAVEAPVETPPALPAALVELAVAEGVELPGRVAITGVVRASERAVIAPKVMGTIRSIPVDLGQNVRAGDLLVRIEAAEISAKVLQAQAQLTQSKRDLERERSLLEKGASTSETVKNLTDRVTIADAMLQEAKAMLGYTELRAPFDGSVSRIYSDEGSLSAPGMPLLEVQGETGYEVEASIPESLAGRLELGAYYSVSLPASEGQLQAVLKEVSSGFDISSRTVTARFSLPGGVSARSGQFAKLVVLGPSKRVVTVPQSAVSRVGQMERVFVAHEGAAQLRLVKTGARLDGDIEVLGGLDAGERVVVGGESALREGQALIVKR